MRMVIKVAVLALVCAGAAFSYWRVRRVWRMAKNMATGSLVCSVAAAIEELDYEQKTEFSGSLGEEWSLLDADEYRRLAAVKGLDRWRVGSKHPEEIVDEWGTPVMIAGRKREGREAEFLVWSKGADGISGTKDDVVCPYGAAIPRELIGVRD
jgi:hypothetical protein